jgi:hypothetical protein
MRIIVSDLKLRPIIASHSRWEAIARSHLQESIGFAADGQDWCYHVRSEWLEIALGRKGAALLRRVVDMPRLYCGKCNGKGARLKAAATKCATSRLRLASSFRECEKERERRRAPLAQSVQNLISM